MTKAPFRRKPGFRHRGCLDESQLQRGQRRLLHSNVFFAVGRGREETNKIIRVEEERVPTGAGKNVFLVTF